MSEANIHVMFSPSAAGTLRQALLMADRKDEVLCPLDNFSFGPIATDDAEARIGWVDEVLGITNWKDVAEKSADFLAAFKDLNASLTAWLSRQETLTYSGFLWWLSHVGEMPVSIIEVAELSQMNEHTMFGLLDHAVALGAEARSDYETRWEQLKRENAPFRVIKDGELVSAKIDHFDDSLLRHVTRHWRKMARIVAGTLVEFDDAGIYQTGDLVLGARLADLAEAGKLEWQGDLSNMRNCELRLPASKPPP